ncbi:MAG TPA: ATP-dependent DNA ligase [Actinomycetota bacterium]|nr:ATP-dependent DNA ligase [Actinomycetota bacterium]
MDLPLSPPIAPMLAKLARDLPRDQGLIYEPKWDGFRCVVFRDRDDVELQSRNQSPLGRYFPELVDALRTLRQQRFVIDGEIIATQSGEPDFSALLARLHPAASRVERLRQETPACLVAFDILAVGSSDVRDEPFRRRRELLEHTMQDAPDRLRLTPTTDDPDVAQSWMHEGNGIDGVVVKSPDLRYHPGKRAMTKVKLERTADCVVAGFRLHHTGNVGSLLLGLFDGDVLRHVGLATSFSAPKRDELSAVVDGYVTDLDGHPWADGFNLPRGPLGRLPGAASAWSDGGELTWVPLRPELVCEVAYEHLERYRFRHPARFRRWRPDRSPRSCTYDQLQTHTVSQP